MPIISTQPATGSKTLIVSRFYRPATHSRRPRRELPDALIAHAYSAYVAGGYAILKCERITPPPMERHAKAVCAETGVEVKVYGFDSGKGMPEPLEISIAARRAASCSSTIRTSLYSMNLPFIETAEAGSFDRRDVDKHILLPP